MFISTTLPYINSVPHIGHCFEFVLADIIVSYNKQILNKEVFFNVGVDEHGQKISEAANREGFINIQEYCDLYAEKWKEFCDLFKIEYDNFYRTTDIKHKENAIRYYLKLQPYIYEKEYEGRYCIACEAFITEKEIINNLCPTHKTQLIYSKELNKFFNLKHFNGLIKNVLVDKSKSDELVHIMESDFDLSITRKNVDWGVKTPDGDTLYVWQEALCNYIFAAGYYKDLYLFKKRWADSHIICGKDNLKFQAYILQALLVANDIPETTSVLVHGTILDEKGDKMSKTQGNVIDPIEQLNKYGLDPVRFYLFTGLNTFNDSKYSEDNLKLFWNDSIVNGLGNLISRLLHLIKIKNIKLDENNLSSLIKIRISENETQLRKLFKDSLFNQYGVKLKIITNSLNERISNERPFSVDCENAEDILNEIYFELKSIIPYYSIILKGHKEKLVNALEKNEKVIIFNKI